MRAPRKQLVYRWVVTDHRMARSVEGHAPSQARAQADATQALRNIGRPLNQGLQATIFRPSGGGWFARQEKGVREFYFWEPWEPVDG